MQKIKEKKKKRVAKRKVREERAIGNIVLGLCRVEQEVRAKSQEDEQ